MRLAVSLSFWLATTSALLLGTHGWLQLQVERRNLETTAQRELSFVGTAIRVAVENAIRDRQEPDIAGLLERLELKEPTIDVFVFGQDGTLLNRSKGSLDNLQAAREVLLSTSTQQSSQVYFASPAALAASLPIHVRDSVAGRLVILRPTDALHADVAAERQAMIYSIVGLIAALSIVIVLVVHFRLHRPMARIINGIQRVAQGDLSSRIGFEGKDEIAELSREFNAMTAGLQEAKQQLAKEAETREQLESEIQRMSRLVMVGELAATLAHEIGSPLQVLNGRARALACRTDLPQDVHRNSEILVEQTDRVIQIVERLLDVARRKSPRFDDLDLQESVRLVTELLATHARRIGVRLEVETHDVPTIRADASQIQQVLLNLLQNAFRACGKGGVVKVSVAPGSFERVTGSGQQPCVTVTVEDDGRGISQTVQQRIFEPFYTDWNDQLGPQGTGLGLSVVQSIVTDHGGNVRAGPADSGMGACFTVHFPVQSVTPMKTDMEKP